MNKINLIVRDYCIIVCIRYNMNRTLSSFNTQYTGRANWFGNFSLRMYKRFGEAA